MNTSRLLGALGLSQKAGKCASGEFRVEQKIKHDTVRLLILDDAVSDATAAKYMKISVRKGIPVLFMKDPGEAIGKPERKILGIMDEQFAVLIQNAYYRERKQDAPELD